MKIKKIGKPETELERLQREAEMIMWYVDVSMQDFIEDLKKGI
jgi:hypothetical protein